MKPANKLRIGLDFDGTFSEDPEFFHRVIDLAEEHGHEVIIVTARPESWGTADIEEVINGRIRVCYTHLVNKKVFMEELGLPIDIWVDDTGPS